MTAAKPNGALGVSNSLLATRAEWTYVIATGLLAAVMVAVTSRDMWFLADIWDHLTRRELDNLSDLLEPRAGHWATPAVVQTRVIYGVFGMDFWPWHFLPRVIGWSLLAVLFWVVLKQRGADSRVAMGSYTVFVVLGTSGFLMPAFIGAVLWVAAAWTAAIIVERTDQPGRKHLIWVFLLLTVAFMSSGEGTAVWAGFVFGVSVTRRLPKWWAPLLGSGLVYFWWFLSYRPVETGAGSTESTGVRISLDLDTLVQVPGNAFLIVSNALAQVLGLARQLGPLLAVVLFAYLGWLIWRRKLTVFDWTMLGGLATYLGLLAISRVGTVSTTDEPRFGHVVMMFILPILLPLVKLPRRELIAAALIIGSWLLFSNAVDMLRTVDRLEERSIRARESVEAAAALIAAGEPFHPEARVDRTVSRVITAQGLAKLVANGWNPPHGPESLERALRGRLRVALSDFPITGDFTAPALEGTEQQIVDGCVTATRDELITLIVTDASQVQILVGAENTVSFAFRDEFGRGRRHTTTRRSTGFFATTIDPEASALLRIRLTAGESMTVCGIAAP